MHTRRSSIVKGHYRNGTWVDEHFRSATTVNNYVKETTVSTTNYLKQTYPWFYNNNTSFKTNCWSCGESVFFYRNENGGCALFDQLGGPWPIHPCWEQYKKERSSIINTIIEKQADQLTNIKVSDYKYIQTVVDEKTECFLLGIDKSCRTIVNNRRLGEASFYFRHAIYSVKNGFIDVLVPEKEISFLIDKPHVYITFNQLRRHEKTIYSIKELRLSPNGENIYKSMNSEIENCIKLNWVTQEFKLYSYYLLANTSQELENELTTDRVRKIVETFLNNLAKYLPKSKDVPINRKINILCINIFDCHWHEFESRILDNNYSENIILEGLVIRNLTKLKIKQKGIFYYFKEINNVIKKIQSLDSSWLTYK